jgi:hypothetical protein
MTQRIPRYILWSESGFIAEVAASAALHDTHFRWIRGTPAVRLPRRPPPPQATRTCRPPRRSPGRRLEPRRPASTGAMKSSIRHIRVVPRQTVRELHEAQVSRELGGGLAELRDGISGGEELESVVPAGATAARVRAKESSSAAWELNGNATTATCGGRGSGRHHRSCFALRCARLAALGDLM